MNRRRQNPVPHGDDSDVEHWKVKADQYWKLNQQLEKDKKRLSEQLGLKDKKDVLLKKRGQWDAEKTKQVASDAGKPVVAAAVTMTLFFKVFEDVGIRYFMGLSVNNFWKDRDITNWTTSLLIMVYASIFKLFAKFDK